MLTNKIAELAMLVLLVGGTAAASVSPPVRSQPADTSSAGGRGYRIDKPGTITFTTGVVIKGKVEKPQVMIFLPKEKSFYEPVSISKSFVKEIMEPMPLIPLVQ